MRSLIDAIQRASGNEPPCIVVLAFADGTTFEGTPVGKITGDDSLALAEPARAIANPGSPPTTQAPRVFHFNLRYVVSAEVIE